MAQTALVLCFVISNVAQSAVVPFDSRASFTATLAPLIVETWDDFAAAYGEEVNAHPELLDWVARMALGTGVVLLCSTHEPCHRDLLAEIVRERLAAGGAG